MTDTPEAHTELERAAREPEITPLHKFRRVGHLSDNAQLEAYFERATCPSRVLTEEDYVEILQYIIERDFFCDLQRFRASQTAETLAPVASLVDPTPSDGVATLKGVPRKSPMRRVKLMDNREFLIDLSQMTLDEFQSLFTSQDNASFQRILEAELAKKAQDQAWIENAGVIQNWKNDALKKAIALGVKSAEILTADVDARTALMFPYSDKMRGRLSVHGQRNEHGKLQLMAKYVCQASAPEPKLERGTLQPHNTRFESAQLDEEMQKAALQSKENAARKEKKLKEYDDMAMQGVFRRRFPNSALATPQASGFSPGIPSLGTETDRAYPLVHTPLFKPGETMTPLITWGEVAHTPMPLSTQSDSSSSSYRAFTIPDPSASDIAAKKLTETVARRVSKQKARQTQALRNLFLTPLLTAQKHQVFAPPSSLQRYASMPRSSRSVLSPGSLLHVTPTQPRVHKKAKRP